jgi:hypothetical protein
MDRSTPIDSTLTDSKAGGGSHQPLKGQKALVTGASSGIGAGVARALGAGPEPPSSSTMS